MATELAPVVIYPEEPPAEDTGVSLGLPAEDPDTGVALSAPGVGVPNLPEKVSGERAKKTQEAIGKHLQKTTEEIKQEISSGREDMLRQQASNKMNEVNSRTKYQMLIDLANSKGTPLAEDEVAKVMDPFNSLNRPVDPNSVIEKQYGLKYINSIDSAIAAIPNNPIQEAKEEIPEEVNDAFLKGSMLTAKMEYARKMREDMETRLGEQSIVGRGVDIIKQMWQPYNEYTMRGLVPEVSKFSGIDLGSNLEAQADKLFGLPFDQYTKVFKGIMDQLGDKNPSLAHRFAEYVEGLSSSDKILDGAFSYMLPLDAAAILKLPLGIARKVSLRNRTNQAVRDYVSVADKVGTDAVGRAEAAGDLSTAAETKSTHLVLQNMSGQSDPIKIATDDTLLTNLNMDKDKLATNPGYLSREQVTRIQDAYDSSGRTILQRIVDAARINRIPMAVATQNAIKVVKEAIKEYYPGIRNAILDVSNPLYEAKSNTFWHEVSFGNIGGDLFSNPNTAQNFARLHGLNDVRIVEGRGIVTPAETERLLERRAKLESNITEWEQTIPRRKAEAVDQKLTAAERAEAKSQHEGISEFIEKARKEVDDITFKLKGEKTYSRANQLEAELAQLKATNKDLRSSLRNENEVVKAATIRVGKEVFEGQTHSDAYEALIKKHGEAPHGFEEGFSTSKRKFVSREEAAKIANKQDQIYPGRRNMAGDRLLAEDLDYKKIAGSKEREHVLSSIKFGEDQIKAKAQEYNAIKQGKAEVVGKYDTVEQQGVGFKIVLRRPLVETDKAVRDLLIRDTSGKLIPEAISTSSQTGFKSLMNAALGRLRGADDTLALNESVNRKIGTYTQSLFKEWASQEAAYIRQIASGVIRKDEVTGEAIPYWRAKPVALWNKITGQQGKTYNEFVRTLDHARDAPDPSGKPGYFFETPGQLQDFYQKNFQRLPSFAEHEAYFAFVRMVEGDRIFREIAEFRNRARVGVEQHSISARGPDGKTMKSDFFDGVSMKHFPGGDDVMMIMSRKLGEEKLVNLGGAGISPKKLAEYKEAVEQGRLRVIRVYAPEHRPLRDFSEVAGNEHVRYVLTDAVETKPIEFNHVNRRGGGHFEYDYDHFLKQAQMYHQYESGVKGRYRSVYTGDTTFMPLLNRVMGRDIADKMHTIQRLIRDGDLEEAKRFTQAHLPIEWDKLHGMFKPGRDEKGRVTPPQLDLNEPFVVTNKGKTVFDMDKDLEARHGNAFKDGTKSGSDNRQFQVAYNTERESSGLSHLEDLGTQGNPLYKYAPQGNMIDPITTMNRSLNRIVNSAFMDDYKIYAVEHWLREAETHLKADLSEIRASPFWHFQSANDKSAFKGGTPPEVIRNLLSNRYKINQFVGVPNSTDTAVHAATQWLVDAAYSSFGPEGARNFVQNAVTVAPLWMLSHIKDPVTFMRSATFHAKLGIWNPAQLLVQAQTFSTILSISPFHGTAGTYATLLHQWSRLNGNPEILKALDNYATKLSVFGQSKWRPGEFTEAMKYLESTGFEKVAGEYANLNTALKTDYVGNDLKSILNAGTLFFREGEKSTRLGAWYTAFREFREANPSGAISKFDLGKILQRADLLTVNMSRASNSMLNSSVLSLPTQFLNYQLRMAELFMGKRLGETLYDRNMARLRLMTFYSALYGAPSAVGLTGLPMANAIRQEALQRGYTPGENWLSTTVDLGLPAMAAALVTGGLDYQKGAMPNFGARYGSPGFTQLQDALKSDTPWWKLLGGASGTTLLNTLTAGHNFFHVMGSMLEPSNDKKAFPLKLDDFVDLFKEISSVNQTWKLIATINTGKWMSKNEAYISDVSAAGAAFFALTGTSPQQQDDSYLKANIRKEEIAFQKYTMKLFIEEYRRGLDASKDGNKEQAADYFKRAFTRLEIAGYPMDKKATAIAIASKNYESQIKSEDFDFGFKSVPQTRSDFVGIPMPFNTQTNIPDTRREQFRTIQKLNTIRGQ